MTVCRICESHGARAPRDAPWCPYCGNTGQVPEADVCPSCKGYGHNNIGVGGASVCGYCYGHGIMNWRPERAPRMPALPEQPAPVVSRRTISGGPATIDTKRLLFLLALSPEERAFVQATLANPGDRSQWLMYADWLLECGREADAAELQGRARK